MATDEERLRELAGQPKVVEVDGQRMETHSLKEQLQLERYLASKQAASGRTRGFRIGKMVAGGA